MIEQFEAFYRQWVILDRIRLDRQFKNVGFDSFEAYMNERMPQGIKKSLADQLIRAKEIGSLLPD